MGLSNEVKLGFLVTLFALGFAFIVLTFGEIPLLRPRAKTYKVYFDDVAGLSVGAEVRVAGIKGGRVRELHLKDGKVEVVFEIEKEIPLYRDAIAQIGTLGLMGDKYLSLYPGNPQSGLLEEGSIVEKNLGYSDTDKLVREMTALSENMKLMAESLNLVITENREDLRRVIKNLELLTYNLNLMAEENRDALRGAILNVNLLAKNLNATLPQTIASIERLAKDLDALAVENREDIRVTVRNLRELSSELKTTLPELSRNLNSLVVENRQDIKTTASNLSELTQKLNTIISKIERGEGTIGKLVHDEELYRGFASGVRALSKTGEVAERTNLYIGFRGEFYRAGDSKGILTLKLQPDKEKYYFLEVVGDSRGRVYKEEILPNQYIVRKEFKPEVTLQYARIFPVLSDKLLVLRGGLKESTGGVGADLIYSERLSFTTDLWDFGRRDRPQDKDLKPNLQVGVNYNLRGPLYIRAGGDDLLNNRLRGIFGGIGLMFTDNDLKYLLGGLRLPLP
ncbi:MAG: MCE family protein [Acidobacteria bacterium]|nr:MAG: MCE family protein [Acidobacteriota bacterium]